MNPLPLLSVYDVYCGGLNNQHRAFQSTPYSGTYTSLIDTGVTSPGLAAHFYRSDRRQHGSMTFSEQAAGRISMRLAKSHYVPVGDHHYVQAPAATRGFPHGLIPGVHAATRHYIDALEEARGLTGRSDAAATEGLFSLPFGPWTQALRPDVESTADSTLRHGFRVPEQLSVSTGRSFIPDSTAEDEAILTEPLFRRPCIASVGDNPWATAYEHMEGFFNACNTLSVIARRLPRRVGHGAVHSLWFCMDAFHGHSNAFDSTPELQLAADACVILMGALYPATWEINLPMVPRGYAAAASRLARRVAEGHGCGPITQLGLEHHDLAECQRRWPRSAARRQLPAPPCTARAGAPGTTASRRCSRCSPRTTAATLSACRFEAASDRPSSGPCARRGWCTRPTARRRRRSRARRTSAPARKTCAAPPSTQSSSPPTTWKSQRAARSSASSRTSFGSSTRCCSERTCPTSACRSSATRVRAESFVLEGRVHAC